jgi:hypothetical protein
MDKAFYLTVALSTAATIFITNVDDSSHSLSNVDVPICYIQTKDGQTLDLRDCL